MKRSFKLSINGKTTFDLDIEGDDDIVDFFAKKALLESIDSYDMRNFFTGFLINGIKSEIQIVQRDSRGHFIKKSHPSKTNDGGNHGASE